MKKRRAHRPRVTNRAAAAPVSGLAALALALVPHHAASAPHATGVTSAGGDETSAISEQSRFRALVFNERRHSDAALPVYAVKPGDNLSEIAWQHCGQARYWTGIYAASHLHGDANVIRPGEELTLDCRYDAADLGKATTPRSSTRLTSANVSAPVQSAWSGGSTARQADQDACTPHCPYGDGDGDSMDRATSPWASAPQQASSGPVTQAATTVSNLGGSVRASSSYEACVIARESGGNAQVMNASGHYGLYQFDLGTWESGGGAPGDFGHASPAEQQRVFDAVYAARGTNPWSPSDGC